MTTPLPFRAFGVSDDEYLAQQVLVDGVPGKILEVLINWLLAELIEPDRRLTRNLGFQILADLGLDLGRAQRAGQMLFWLNSPFAS